MFVTFQTSSINLAHVVHASVLADGTQWKFSIQFINENKVLSWPVFTRKAADELLAKWTKLVCPPTLDLLAANAVTE